MTPDGIKLGQRVRDLTSGYEGIVIQKTEMLSGTVQYAVQPPVKDDGKYPDAMNIDYQLLEVIDDGIVDRAAEADPDVAIKLGEQVEDSVTGFTGIATAKGTYLNGCVRFGVVGKYNQEALLPRVNDENWLDHKRLRKIDNGVNAVVGQNTQPQRLPGLGGPVSKAVRM